MIFALITLQVAFAQNYQSTLKDKATGEAIDAATVVLLAADSTTVAVTTSDTTGQFNLAGEGAKWLQVTHLVYHPLRIELSSDLPKTLYLEQQSELLDELVVKADRPLMKLVDGGIPSYDIDVLFENSTVTTAYEMLGRLPGMAMEGGVPVLAGTSGYTLILNGKPSNIPQDQLLEMLKTIPVQMVANVEISYAPIARYRAKGASINVILKTQSENKQLSGLSGQVFGEYNQKYYATFHGGGNLVYSTPRGLSITANYKGSKDKSRTDLSYDTAPFGNTNGFKVNNVGWSNYNRHSGFLDLVYNAGKHSASLNYFGDFTPRGEHDFQIDALNPISPERHQYRYKATNHIALEYAYDKLTLGAFYTHFKSDVEIKYGMEKSPLPSTAVHTQDNQVSQVFGAHIDHSKNLQYGWGIEYGSKFSYSNTDNRQEVLHNLSLIAQDAIKQQNNRELLADAYLGMKKQFSPQLNAGLTLIADYTKHYDHEETFQIIPQVSMTYVVNPDNMIQFHLNSNKVYPSYWEREPFANVHSDSQIWIGNPELKPFVNYSGQLTYIHKRKYIFLISDSYAPNFFNQQIHLNPDLGKIVYKTWNWDYYNQLQVGAILPLPQTNWWQGRLTLMTSLNSLKMDVPFEPKLRRDKFMFFGMMTNDFTLGQKDNVTLGLDLNYVHGGMQGFYDFGDMWNLTGRAKWTSQDKKWSVTLNATDILNMAIPKIKADYGIHKFDFQPFKYNTTVSLDVRYTFGGFKTTRKPNQLNTDRFGM